MVAIMEGTRMVKISEGEAVAEGAKTIVMETELLFI